MSPARKSSSGRTGKQRIGRVLVVAGVVAALAFAVQGGEYGTTDLWRQKQRRARLLRTNDSLVRVVDSLRSEEHTSELQSR